MIRMYYIMKKIIIVSALVLFAGTVFSQCLKKGSFIGVQAFNIELGPGVTLDQYLKFTMKTFIPEAEKAFPGMKVFLMEGGVDLSSMEELENAYSLVYYFESERVQGNYFDKEGNLTEEGTAAMEMLEPTFEQYEKLGYNSAPLIGWKLL